MDDLDESAQQAIEDAAAKGVLITQSRQVPVSNLGHMKAGVIQKNVQAAIPYAFNVNHFTAAHQVGKFRPPPNGDPAPEKTRHDFAVYDAAHGDYTYTPAYQKYLIKKCSTEEGFKSTTGRHAMPKKVKVAVSEREVNWTTQKSRCLMRLSAKRAIYSVLSPALRSLRLIQRWRQPRAWLEPWLKKQHEQS